MSERADRTPEAWVADLLYGTADGQAAAAAELEALGVAATSALCPALQEVQAQSRALYLQLLELEPFQPGSRSEEARLRWELAENEERVIRLARVLQAIRAREALYPLLEALRRSHSREAHALAQALAPLGAPAIPLLDEALESRLLWVAMSAAEALATIGGPEVAHRLVRRLQHASHDLLRVCLIRCLGRLGDPVAVVPLCALITGGNRDERLYAVEALGRIGDPRAVAPLLHCLAAEGAYSSDVLLQSAALRALGRLADPRGIAPLIRALQDSRAQLYEPAVAALAEIAERHPVVELRSALPALRSRLRRSQVERESVLRAAAALADRIETLTAPLKSLPVPAPGSAPAADQLPRPAESTRLIPEKLPIPGSAADDTASTVGRQGPARWIQRWRKRS